jgi:hypothetical protein
MSHYMCFMSHSDYKMASHYNCVVGLKLASAMHTLAESRGYFLGISREYGHIPYVLVIESLH